MIIEFEKSVLVKAKRVFRLRGTIKRCAELTKIDRTTIPRAIKAGTGEETTVNTLTEYINKVCA